MEIYLEMINSKIQMLASWLIFGNESKLFTVKIIPRTACGKRGAGGKKTMVNRRYQNKTTQLGC